MKHTLEQCTDFSHCVELDGYYTHPFLKPIRSRRDVSLSGFMKYQETIRHLSDTLPQRVVLNLNNLPISPNTYEERLRDAITSIVYNPHWDATVDVSKFVNLLKKFRCGGTMIFNHNLNKCTVAIEEFATPSAEPIVENPDKSTNIKHPYVCDYNDGETLLHALVVLLRKGKIDRTEISNMPLENIKENRLLLYPDIICMKLPNSPNHLMGYVPPQP